MKKNITSTLIICLLFLTGAPSAQSETSVSADLDPQFKSAQIVGKNTIASPLLLAEKPEELDAAAEAKSLLAASKFSVGSTGGLEFEVQDGNKVQIRFQGLEKPGAFFWRFDKAVDLRDQWVRLRYGGENIPLAALLSFESGKQDGNHRFYLQPFSRKGESYFKLPDDAAFGGLTVIRFVFDPVLLGTESADFRIEDIQILEKGADPLIKNITFHGEQRPGKGLPEPFTTGQSSLSYSAHT